MKQPATSNDDDDRFLINMNQLNFLQVIKI